MLNALGNLAGLLLGSAAAAWVAGPPLAMGSVASVAVEARPVALDARDPARGQVGRLAYLGGLELRATDRRFGGISALLWEPACNRLLAVTDTGAWVILAPEESGDRLVGLRAAWMAPLADTSGRPPASKFAADAEGLARLGDALLVSFELDHRLQEYRGVSACEPESLGRPAVAVHRPAAMQGWPSNGGAEAIADATTAKGERLLILSEDAARPGGLRDGFLWSADDGATTPVLHRPPRGGSGTMQATGMDRVPGTDRHLILFRRFTPLEGVSALVAERTGDLRAGDPAPFEVAEIARFAPPLAVDNMEGIAVRREGERLFVYLVSDDNFNPLQKTLLLKFELLP
jgi:hypothetical protein